MLDYLLVSPQRHAQTARGLWPPRAAPEEATPMLAEWRRPLLDPRRETNLVVESYHLYLQLRLCDSMGCQQSHAEGAEEDSVESLRYSRRSTKIKRSKRKKLSKTKSGGSEVDHAPEENGGDVVPHEDTPPEPSKKAKDKNAKRKKTKNGERNQIFSSSQQSIKNVLTLSVDTPEAAEIEAKQGKFGSKHVFPIWESHYNETCKCDNAAEANGTGPEDDSRKPRMSSDQLCKRCSQLLLHNKKGVSNNNISGGATDPPARNVAVETPGTAGAGQPAPADPSSLTSDPFQSMTQQTQIAAIANLLVLAALDLSVPASNLLVKNRKNAWIQLAGHPGSFAPAGPKTIWKKRLVKENYETLAYQALCEYQQSKNIMPTFHREVEFNGEYFIEIEDLLHHFNDPSIMDIKMGTRTFLEVEVKNPVLRKDLYEKMVKVDPNAPTAEERAQEAITKLRYMQFREHESSTASLGFRIEAIRMSGEPPNTNLKKVRTKEEVSYFIETFVKGHEVVIPSLHQRLCDIRDKFESIPFFQSHEIIGSSLLIMFDSSNHAGVWMIDFAKTIPVENTLTHREPWEQGNHEDGYLTGLDNLVEIFGELSQKQQQQGEAS
ncbi:inositol-trisphosphate 3-kinase B [Biomphalaria glabrata]|uniref:Kinase n=1 Tax=Biomphalaria glabrata TaxID=6526 RepID=A0A9W2Z4U1_BIOGL|nr:inositol-trisphosphate 3-kinase A-like isoform X1 [Biomphalaria glabrata]XP_055869944.1 inositol-trisphosphate 3-kinase A-like isoform X1 [Biomphalaria glabrata]KAI8738840.1 inositol-trisphosphate 3-kinase B-like [Biomphalaria glabrata]